MYEEEMLEIGAAALFSLFGRPVYPYALLMALGAAAALIMALWRARRTGRSVDAVLVFAMLALPLGVILGRAVFCAARVVDVMDFGLGYVFRIDYGGFSLVGASLGVLLAGVLTRALSGQKFTDVMDAVMPGLLVMLAIARFAEGATTNGTGPEVSVAALRFAPLARQDLYGDYAYAINFFEGLTALTAGVYTQTLRRPVSGQVAATGAIIVAAGQILWESARRDELLIFSFVRYAMVFGALVLAVLLVLSLRRTAWHWGGKALVLAGFLLAGGAVGAMEFAIDGKILAWLPFWACYLVDALCVILLGWLTLTALNTACREQQE